MGGYYDYYYYYYYYVSAQQNAPNSNQLTTEQELAKLASLQK